jgi:hypothetical protein
MFVGPAVIAFVVALIALFGPFVSDEIEFRRKLRIAQQKARLAIEQRDLEEQPERRRLEEQLPRASEGVAYLLEQMLAAEGDPNATSQQKKEWRALFHKAKIEYEKLRQRGRILGVAPHYSRTATRLFPVELVPNEGAPVIRMQRRVDIRVALPRDDNLLKLTQEGV